MCPLYLELRRRSGFEVSCLVTGQHREMLDGVLGHFGVVPDFDLDLMRHGQTLTDVTTGVLRGVGEVLEGVGPDVLLVHGDTTTGFAAGLAGFYRQVPVGHVEAGMRSLERYSPFPEEVNRRLISVVASVHFAATETNRRNLLAEGVADDDILVCGNTVIDAVRVSHDPGHVFADPVLRGLDFGRRVVLMTVHRRENIGPPMHGIFSAVRDVLDAYPDVEVVFPIHRNQAVRDAFAAVGVDSERMHLVEPLEYGDFIQAMSRCWVVLTDSGGIQEEAPFFGRPVVVVRDVTERTEAVEAGTVVLAGTARDRVYGELARLLDDPGHYASMARALNPYGDGHACERIVAGLEFFLGLGARPEPFRGGGGL